MSIKTRTFSLHVKVNFFSGRSGKTEASAPSSERAGESESNERTELQSNEYCGGDQSEEAMRSEEATTDAESSQDDSSVFDADLEECLDAAIAEEDAKNEPKQSESEAKRSADATTPLMHSVSFYRVLQKQNRQTPEGATPVLVKPPVAAENGAAKPVPAERRSAQSGAAAKSYEQTLKVSASN